MIFAKYFTPYTFPVIIFSATCFICYRLLELLVFSIIVNVNSNWLKNIWYKKPNLTQLNIHVVCLFFLNLTVTKFFSFRNAHPPTSANMLYMYTGFMSEATSYRWCYKKFLFTWHCIGCTFGKKWFVVGLHEGCSNMNATGLIFRSA